jgi:hypothetical protein
VIPCMTRRSVVGAVQLGESPRGVLSHQRILVLPDSFQPGNKSGIAGIADHYAQVPEPAAKFHPLDGRAGKDAAKVFLVEGNEGLDRWMEQGKSRSLASRARGGEICRRGYSL